MNITVMTPTLTPRMVSAERNLFERTVSKAIQADSLMSAKDITVFNQQAKIDRGYSERSASIGSSFAARHAGHRPLITPTTDETPTPNTADQMLKSSGKPIKSAIIQAVAKTIST